MGDRGGEDRCVARDCRPEDGWCVSDGERRRRTFARRVERGPPDRFAGMLGFALLRMGKNQL